MADRAISYLKSIVKYCEDISNIHDSYDNSYDKYYTHKGYQYSISFCIEQIGEIGKKLRDAGYADKYPQVPWNEIAGLRNRIAHGYDAIDLEMVYDISINDVPQLLKNCRSILDTEIQKEFNFCKTETGAIDEADISNS